jgi:hypothetical protein
MASTSLEDFFNPNVLQDADLLYRLRESFHDYFVACQEHSKTRQKTLLLVIANLARSLAETKGLPMKVAQVAAFLDPQFPDELRDFLEHSFHFIIDGRSSRGFSCDKSLAQYSLRRARLNF